MNETVNLQDLAASLAEKSGISKRDAESFLREYFGTLSNALLEDKLIKIKKLGTFKLTAVEDRASVDVNTKERVIIPAHYKINYVPDSQLAEIINEPFSMFESVDLSSSNEEQVDKKVADRERTVMPVVASPPLEKKVVELLPPPAPVSSEETVEETVEEEQEQEEQEEEIQLQKPEGGQVYYKPVGDRNRRERNINWIAVVSIALLFVMAGVVLFVHMEEQRNNQNYLLSAPARSKPETENVEKAKAPEVTVADESEKVDVEKSLPVISKEETERENVLLPSSATNNKSVPTEKLPVEKPSKETEVSKTNTSPQKEITVSEGSIAKEKPATIATTPAPEKKPVALSEESIVKQRPGSTSSNDKTRKLLSGETLRIVAEKELGNREFWIYIYLKNQAKIKDPNQVIVGTQLAIPHKSEYGGIDANDPRSIERAKNRASQFE